MQEVSSINSQDSTRELQFPPTKTIRFLNVLYLKTKNLVLMTLFTAVHHDKMK